VEAEEKAEMVAAKAAEVEVEATQTFILILTMTPLRVHLPQLYRIVERVTGVTCLAFLKDLLPHILGRNQRKVERRKALRHLLSNVKLMSLLNTSLTSRIEDL